jgi:hypothetical protein
MAGRDIATLPAYLGGPVDPLLEEGVESAFNTSYARANAPAADDRAALPPSSIRDAEFDRPQVSQSHGTYRDEPPPLDLDSSERPPTMADDRWRHDEPGR